MQSKGPFTQAILSKQLDATQCNFCHAEVATSCDFIAILVQFVSVNISTRLLLKQKLYTVHVYLLKGETTTQNHRVS